MRLIDLSHPLDNDTPPFPGDPAVEIAILDQTSQTGPEERRNLNCGQIRLPIHCGTHIDAPYHFYADRPTIDQIPLERCTGRATVIELFDQPIIDADLLAPFHAQFSDHTQALLHTGWYHQWQSGSYFTDHPVLSADGAEFLAETGIDLIGVDFPSVDRPPHPAHLVLLGRSVLIVENLTNLAALDRVSFEFSAIPLAIVGRDGSPVRAFARIAD